MTWRTVNILSCDPATPKAVQSSRATLEKRAHELAKEREANDLKGELDSANVTIPRLEGAVSEARNKLQSYEAKFRSDALAELNQARSDQQGTEATGVAMKDRVERAIVKSPVNGTIKTVKVSTVGGVGSKVTQPASPR